MTVLPPEVQKELWANLMREQSDRRQSTPLTKFELFDTIVSVDEQLDSFIEQLRQNITIKAQTALTEGDWLRMLETIVGSRQRQEVKPKDEKGEVAVEVKP